MADHGFDVGEEFKYDADDSDLGDYEDVADVIARTKRRVRAQRAKQRAELQKALEENQRRQVAREAEHQARLKRLDDFRRHVRKRNKVPPRIAKQIDPDSTLRKSPRSPRSEDCMTVTPPPKPEGGRQRRVGPRTRQMRLKAKRQAEVRRRELQNDAALEEQTPPPEPEGARHRREGPRTRQMRLKAKRKAETRHRELQNDAASEEQQQAEALDKDSQSDAKAEQQLQLEGYESRYDTEIQSEAKADEQPQDEQQDEQQQDEAHGEVSQEILLAQARVAQRKREEMERKLQLEEEQAQLREEINRRNAIARQVGHRRVLYFLKEKADQEESEAEQRAAWLREHMEKKREKAAADAIKLPKMRAEAARRGMQWLSEEKQLKEKIRSEEIAQRKARREKWQQYKSPKLIAKIKGCKGKRIGNNRAAITDEVSCEVTGEPAATDSTDCPSDHDVQATENRNPQMQAAETTTKAENEKVGSTSSSPVAYTPSVATFTRRPLGAKLTNAASFVQGGHQAAVANEAAHNVVGDAVAFIASEQCSAEDPPQQTPMDVVQDIDHTQEPSVLPSDHSLHLRDSFRTCPTDVWQRLYGKFDCRGGTALASQQDECRDTTKQSAQLLHDGPPCAGVFENTAPET